MPQSPQGADGHYEVIGVDGGVYSNLTSFTATCAR